MKKNILLLGAAICVITFCACQNNSYKGKDLPNDAYIKQTKSGAYLAGRVAHIRKDFGNAAKYYAKTVDMDSENKQLLSQLYIIYTSNGDLQNASKYAKRLKEKGDDSDFLNTIIAVDEIKEKKYQEVIKNLSSSQVPIYKQFINPLILAWAYAGENDIEKAVANLKPLMQEPSFEPLYKFQLALIYDYFNEDEKTLEYFNEIALSNKQNLSFRALQLISNFYLRQGEKQKAIDLVSMYGNDELFSPMLKRLLDNIKKQKGAPKKEIDTPSKGLAESLFSIAATIRAEGQNADLAHLFASMSIYSNPDYDLAKLLLADVFEERGMNEQAIDIYDSINKDSQTYDIVLMKKAKIYSDIKEYKKAQNNLEELIKLGAKNTEVYLNLGDALKRQKKYKESIKAFNKAFAEIKKVGPEHWVLYYSTGVSYEKNKELEKAEDMLLKALSLSNDHYLVQNYLGYVWIYNEKNTDKAFALIVDAYRQAPNDGNIVDSLGFAFYKLGFYDKAIAYLEDAALLEPNNPLILEHLGDAYFMGGRKIEAAYQWRQALLLNDGEDEDFNPEVVELKIKEGLNHSPIKIEDEAFVLDKIKELEE